MANGVPKKQQIDEQRRKKRAAAACVKAQGAKKPPEGYPSTLVRETGAHGTRCMCRGAFGKGGQVMAGRPSKPRGFFKNGDPYVETPTTRAAAARRGHGGPRCQVCDHPDRARIEFAKVSGRGLHEVANEFGVHKDALWRHMTKHVSEETKIGYLAGPVKLAELANLAAGENKSLLEYLSILRSILFGQLDRSAQRGKPFEIERISGRALDTLREIGRLTGELSAFTSQSINVVNNQTLVMNSPIVTELQAALLETLAPYQDARAAVIAMFVRLDERHRGSDMKLIEAGPISRSESIKAGQAAKREREREALHA